jgi:hypothetical protein
MVEQVTFQTLFQFLQTVGILVGVYYYISTIRVNQKNQEISLKSQETTLETRQTNILMNLHTYLTSDEYQNAFATLAKTWEDMEHPIDPDAFIERYGPPNRLNETWIVFFKVCQFWNGVGVLVETGLADFDVVNKLWGHMVTWVWGIVRPLVIYEREFLDQPRYFEWFEYLNGRVVEHERTRRV